MTIASLPMYDADRSAVEQWWQGLARHLRHAGIDDVPEALSWPDDLDAHWRDPALLLSQTCGYPLMHTLGEAVQLIGTPCYDVPGCEGPAYTSQLVVRHGDVGRTLADFRGRTVAFNSMESHSGYNALRALVAPMADDGRFFGCAVASGSHRQSLELVQRGQADIAAIDCVSWAALQRHEPQSTQCLHVIGSTAAVPGLPWITAGHADADRLMALRRGVQAAFADATLALARQALHLCGFEVIGRAQYQVIADMRSQAFAWGCTQL